MHTVVVLILSQTENSFKSFYKLIDIFFRPPPFPPPSDPPFSSIPSAISLPFIHNSPLFPFHFSHDLSQFPPALQPHFPIFPLLSEPLLFSSFFCSPSLFFILSLQPKPVSTHISAILPLSQVASFPVFPYCHLSLIFYILNIFSPCRLLPFFHYFPAI